MACPACGFAVAPAAKFCAECGQRLDTAAPSVQAAETFPAPQAYTPGYLAEKILTSRHALEGERKQVTVLFADIKGSTELIEGLDPEEARRLLDPALHVMMDAVHRFEGTVNQVLGDGIYGPVWRPDRPRRPCPAGLLCRPGHAGGDATICRRRTPRARSGTAYPGWSQLRGGRGAGHRQRPAHGLLGGGPDHTSGSAHGAACSAWEHHAGGANPAAGGGFSAGQRLRTHSRQGPDGAGRGVRTPRCQCRPRRLQATAARGLTRFVGRDTEIEALHQALARARAGHGQVVACVGEAGVGKSRLVYEVVHSHRTRDWLVLESASVSYGKATPYFPVIDLLKRYAHVEDHDDTRTVRPG